MTFDKSIDDMGKTEETRALYTQYYEQKGRSRNDSFLNPQVFFQEIASDLSLHRALKVVCNDIAALKVLDVGCGFGGSLLPLIRLGANPQNLTGVDIQPERIELAKKRLPHIELLCCDASRLPFQDNSFDLVLESTMFLQITDDAIAQAISSEMIRVAKVGGHIILRDWVINKPGSKHYKALTRKRCAVLFEIGSRTRLHACVRGSLIPPVGRFLSAYLPSIYFLIAAAFPFLVGLRSYALEKLK